MLDYKKFTVKVQIRNALKFSRQEWISFQGWLIFYFDESWDQQENI